MKDLKNYKEVVGSWDIQLFKPHTQEHIQHPKVKESSSEDNRLHQLLSISDQEQFTEAHIEEFNALLDGGIDPNIQDEEGFTALHLALMLDKRKGPTGEKLINTNYLVSKLLEKGANPNIQDKEGILLYI